ncbi:MAG: SDR family oxidoreductase [Anaerolineae bacterium]|nr:SDR family oxidoreductase [Anaerolineae bacterium]
MESGIVLVTGASSGLGQAAAEHLAQKGYTVYGTSRRAPLEGESRVGVRPLRMDVDDSASVRQGIDLLLRREGRIDVVINCAGYGMAGAVESTPVEAFKAQLETNFYGTLRVCQAVLPHMRERRAGMIINVSSVGGLIAIPFQSMYSASKFAVEGVTEALRLEARPFGVRVVLVEPGDFATRFTANRRAIEPDAAYAANMRRAVAVMEHDEQHGARPAQFARLIEWIVRSKSPRLRYMVGPFYERAAVWLKILLPSRLFEWAFSKYYQQEQR